RERERERDRALYSSFKTVLKNQVNILNYLIADYIKLQGNLWLFLCKSKAGNASANETSIINFIRRNNEKTKKNSLLIDIIYGS
ncbi:MAG: hypothetical protein FWH53_05455, partial [Leptospirales bacterium]|nr:hypothetical protein [Leptospirales bacterium]